MGKPGRRCSGVLGRSGLRLNLGALPLLGGGPCIRPSAHLIAVQNEKALRRPRLVRAARSASRSGSTPHGGGYVVGLRPEERSESAEESAIQPTPPASQINGLDPLVPPTKTSLRLRRIRSSRQQRVPASRSLAVNAAEAGIRCKRRGPQEPFKARIRPLLPTPSEHACHLIPTELGAVRDHPADEAEDW